MMPPELEQVPPPVLFNTWKHHAGFLRCRLAQIARGDDDALANLPAELRVVGTDLMDLYVGSQTPADIACAVVALLQHHLEPASFRTWLEQTGGFAVLTLATDRSRWVVRWGDDPDRYVHLHPARRSPHTRRVRANVLKTAVMAWA